MKTSFWIDLFFSKNFDPKGKLSNNQWEKLNRSHYLTFSKFCFLKVPFFVRSFLGWYFICLRFFLAKSLQKNQSLWKSTRNFVKNCPRQKPKLTSHTVFESQFYGHLSHDNTYTGSSHNAIFGAWKNSH